MCSGQVKLATVLELVQKRFSISFINLLQLMLTHINKPRLLKLLFFDGIFIPDEFIVLNQSFTLKSTIEDALEEINHQSLSRFLRL